jgi:very-short-patch-repair endonuclease
LNRPAKPAATIRRAKRLRREMTLPEVLLWRHLRGSPEGVRFRKQHAAGDYVLDFFCARANLAIEIDGISHDMGDQPQSDEERDSWLAERRIDTVRIPARDVLADPSAVAESIVAFARDRLARFGKTPPSGLWPATSPSQVDGEDLDA